MYWQYFKYVIKHKWYVIIECFKMGIYWRGIVHDLSKFRPSEFFAYARYFYGRKTSISEEDFKFAWHKHQKRNDHHWEWWVIKDDKCFPMSHNAVIEMVADWKGAGKAIHGVDDVIPWYKKNRDRIILHKWTRTNVEYILAIKEWDKRYFV